MVRLLLLLAPLLLPASSALASSSGPPQDLDARKAAELEARYGSGSARQLFARQTLSPDQVPASCLTPCTAISNTVTACADINCICTQANAASLTVCVSCVITTDPGSTLATQARGLMNQFYSSCSSVGIPISSIPLNGATATLPQNTITAAGTTTAAFTYPQIMTSMMGSNSPMSTGNNNNPFAHMGNAALPSANVVGAWARTLVAGVLTTMAVAMMVVL